jgi:hypothetical protein
MEWLLEEALNEDKVKKNDGNLLWLNVAAKLG